MGELTPQSAPWSCRVSLTSMCVHGHGRVFPAGNSRFSHEAGASLPAGLHKEGKPLGLLRQGCALLSLTWPVKGLHPRVSDWVSNYNNYDLLELAIKGCLKSVVLYKTFLLILILNIQLTDRYWITYISTPLESWFWVNNLTWTVFPLNKVHTFTICYATGWRKRTISKLWGGLGPFQDSGEWDGTFRAVWKCGSHCKARVCQNEWRAKLPHTTRS